MGSALPLKFASLNRQVSYGHHECRFSSSHCKDIEPCEKAMIAAWRVYVGNARDYTGIQQ
jgi:hypothetical protein